jgi:hypothetical protein
MQQPDTQHSLTSLPDLPPHLQHHIFASAAAPLTTCKATAAIAQDASLTTQWLLVKGEQPLLTALRHGLWDVCDKLLNTHQYTPGHYELCPALRRAAGSGRTEVVSSLLRWCCMWRHERCSFCNSVCEAMWYATSQGHVQVCSLLIQHPAITPQHARDAVCRAARYGQLEMLRLPHNQPP